MHTVKLQQDSQSIRTYLRDILQSSVCTGHVVMRGLQFKFIEAHHQLSLGTTLASADRAWTT